MRRSWLAGLVGIAAIACALGCGGRARFAPRPGQVWLAGLRVEGNRAVDGDDLIPTLALTRAIDTGRPIDPHQLALDTGRIRAHYLRLGYFEVQVKARIEDKRGAQTAVFEVTEGKRARMEVVIRGLPPEVPLARARALISIPDGGHFDYEIYDEARLPLQALVERAGYAHVQLEAYVSAERSKSRAVAIYELAPGPRCTFGGYSISGADGPLLEAIQHRIAFRTGAVYSPEAIAATQRDLYALGRFSTVLVAPQRTPGETTIPVKITVALGSRHEVRLGGGVGLDPSTYEARVRGGLSYVPLANPLWTFGADARVAGTLLRSDTDDFEPKFRARASALRTDLLRPRVSGDASIGYDLLAIEGYTSRGPQLGLGLSSPLGVRWLTARLGWAFSYLEFFDIHDVIIDEGAVRSLGLDRNQRLGAYQLALTADLRDNPLDPKRGVYAAVRSQVGTPFAGGASTFLQVTPEVRTYLSLGTPRLVFATRLRAGAILTNEDPPVTERYFSGGAGAHRGFYERKLSPTLVHDYPPPEGEVAPVKRYVPIGGKALLEASAELRIALGTAWSFPYGVALFVDAGEVWNDAYLASLSDLHWATGAEISAQAGGVKIRFDIGFRLNQRTPDQPDYEEWYAWHFGLGDSF